MTPPRNLMAHLVADFPDQAGFGAALRAMLKSNVAYLEIQLPFNHPLADGPTIRRANYTALQHGGSLPSLLECVSKVKEDVPSSVTRLFLMTYATPVFDHFSDLADMLMKYGFSGAIIPDLPLESQEAKILLQSCKRKNLMLVPVVAPTTQSERLQMISQMIPADSLVYAVVRTGQTGGRSVLDAKGMEEYFAALRRVFPTQPIAVGFGIRDKDQVQFVQNNGFIPVIGSAFVERITSAHESLASVEQVVSNFLSSIDVAHNGLIQTPSGLPPSPRPRRTGRSAPDRVEGRLSPRKRFLGSL